MISFAHDVADDRLVPAGTARPKASAVVDWLNLLVNYFAPGEHDARLRGYLKALVQPTWEYVQHLLHDKHATRMDAEIGLAAVAHLRGRSSKLGLRPHQVVNSRCARVLHVGSALRVMTCPDEC
jgi:hypothetical protein